VAKRWLLWGDFADPHRQHGPDIASSCASGGASYSVLRKVEMAAADVEKQGTGEIAVWLITAWFIWVVLLWSTLISAFVIFRMNQEPWEGTDSAVLSVAIVGIVASVLAWMSYEAPAFFRRRTEDELTARFRPIVDQRVDTVSRRPTAVGALLLALLDEDDCASGRQLDLGRDDPDLDRLQHLTAGAHPLGGLADQ